MIREREPQTFTVDYQDAKERDRGIAEMTRQGYGVLAIVPHAGMPKKSKVGGAGVQLPNAGTRRSECYKVTFTEIQ
jgi:hypothetical protein